MQINQSELALKLSVTKAAVNQWIKGTVPWDRCAQIERALKGSVTCEESRPDLPWRRIESRSWPWHRKGAPLIDVSKLPPKPTAKAKQTEAA